MNEHQGRFLSMTSPIVVKPYTVNEHISVSPMSEHSGSLSIRSVPLLDYGGCSDQNAQLVRKGRNERAYGLGGAPVVIVHGHQRHVLA